MIPQPLQDLIKTLSKTPGLGPRSAQRAALHLLSDKSKMGDLRSQLAAVAETVVTCQTCGNIGLATPCHVCTDSKRDATTICVVEGVDDLWAIERSGSFSGMYHVLGGVVSAIDGIGPEDVNIPQLATRVAAGEVVEVILALGASVDGQTTAHLISRKLQQTTPELKITSLAKGIPVGAQVDYMDDGTLALALQGRLSFN